MSEPWVLALSGGVGGAKLCLGLQRAVPAGSLHIVANTADDFTLHGLRICPDIDTLLYTLSGRSNREQGWGLAGESWHVLEALRELGGETWFQLGDRDLATHLWRTGALSGGDSLGEVTAALAQHFGVTATLYPMCEQPVSTLVHTDLGDLDFQRYFVEHRCEPTVSGFEFRGVEQALPPEPVIELLADRPPAAVVLCPSNPFVSMDPVLAVPGLWQALAASDAPVLAVSPIVAGSALKGPAAKMMAELGLAVTAAGVAAHYAQRYPGLVDCFVLDDSDATLAADVQSLGLRTEVMPTVMRTDDDKRALAQRLLDVSAEMG